LKKATANKKTALRVVREPPDQTQPNLSDDERPGQKLIFMVIAIIFFENFVFYSVLCKCLCGLNVTADDMLEAMMYLVETRKKLGFEKDQRLLTTTTTPKPKVGWK